LDVLTKSNAQKPYSHSGYRTQLYRQATRIAINRTVAGVHFPVDSMAGCVLGLALADYFIQRATRAAGNAQTVWFNPSAGAAELGGADFDVSDYINVGSSGSITTHKDWISTLDLVSVSAPSDETPLSWLWTKAKAEW
jgi:hypothetical protein